jgi:hypothetical protein
MWGLVDDADAATGASDPNQDPCTRAANLGPASSPQHWHWAAANGRADDEAELPTSRWLEQVGPQPSSLYSCVLPLRYLHRHTRLPAHVEDYETSFLPRIPPRTAIDSAPFAVNMAMLAL